MEKENIFYQLKSLEKTITRTFFCNHKQEMLNRKVAHPTATQHQIIEYILDHRNEEIFQKDLEKILNLRRATVSGVLQTMEKNELIERITDKQDTRTKKIILNKKAKKIFESGEKKLIELEKRSTKDISKNDLEIFSKVLLKMKENIKNENSNK